MAVYVAYGTGAACDILLRPMLRWLTPAAAKSFPTRDGAAGVRCFFVLDVQAPYRAGARLVPEELYTWAAYLQKAQ
eukprot:12740423-Alexandrium_andersonii.AAC.1